MKCPQCGFENVENSKHCLNCGARMDGNILCPKCSKAISRDYDRCPHCNHKIPHFVEQPVSEQELTKKEKITSTFNKVFLIVIIALLATSLGLVFGQYISFYKNDIQIDGNAYYFLVQSWKETLSEFKNSGSKLFRSTLMIEHLVSFVFVVLNIITTYIFGVMGIIKSVRALRRKGYKECNTYFNLGVVFLSNIITVAVLLSLKCDFGDQKCALAPGFSSYFGTMFFAMFAMSVFSIVIRHQNGQRSPTFEKIVFSLNYFISIVIIAVLASTFVTLKADGYSLRVFYGVLNSIRNYQFLRDTNNGITLMIIVIVLALFTIIEAIILMALMIFFSLGFYTDREQSMKFKIPCYGLSFFAFVLSFIMLGLSISAVVFYNKVYGIEFAISYLPIANFVLGLSLFGASIASLTITRRYRYYKRIASQTTIKK